MEAKIEFYQKTITIWNNLCELHKDLLEATSQEYIYLLGSNVDEIENSIKQKELIINKINDFDKKRNDHLEEINTTFNTDIKNFFELNEFFKDIDIEKSDGHLNKFNLLLKELIINIQDQNKTNQIFINKAIINLDKIKNAGTSNKNYTLYNKNGALRK